MNALNLMLLILVTCVAGLSLGLAALLTQGRIKLTATRAERDRARMAEAATLRVLRLAVSDMRSAAMRALGHAEQMGAGGEAPSPHLAGIVAMTRQLLDLADDMQDHAVAGPENRVLELETLPLGPLLGDAIAAVTATLGPSRRLWRMGELVGSCALVADRRAMGLVLGRALANAARESRHEDWIDISVRERDGGMDLIIEDEGTGLVAPSRSSPPGQQESRGMGLGLVLARVLMEAHGGGLAVESASRVGTRVVLSFPASRVSWNDAAGASSAAA
jgi:signal transduction histidine kinase